MSRSITITVRVDLSRLRKEIMGADRLSEAELRRMVEQLFVKWRDAELTLISQQDDEPNTLVVRL